MLTMNKELHGFVSMHACGSVPIGLRVTGAPLQSIGKKFSSCECPENRFYFAYELFPCLSCEFFL